MMRANLHIHSHFSDGTQWPKEIVERVVKPNSNKRVPLELIALTDHDNVAGNREFLESCKEMGIKGVAGVEIDCVGTFKLAKYKSEILGYFPK